MLLIISMADILCNTYVLGLLFVEFGGVLGPNINVFVFPESFIHTTLSYWDSCDQSFTGSVVLL